MSAKPAERTRAQKLRFVYLILLSISVTFYVFEELHLRRWLYKHYGHDSVVAGSLPNFLAVLVLGFAAAVLRVPDRNADAVRLSFAVMAGLILYEVAQIWIPHQVFDWNDIAATLLGGVGLWATLRMTALSLNGSVEGVPSAVSR